MNSVKILHAVRAAITAIAEILVLVYVVRLFSFAVHCKFFSDGRRESTALCIASYADSL